MIHDPALLDQLQELEPHPWEGIVYRHMVNDYPPERTNTRGARWNPPEEAAIYASVDRATVLAEAEYRLSAQIVQPRLKRRTIYEVKVKLLHSLDLQSPTLLRQIGITERELKADDHTPCQKIAGAAAFLDFDSLLVPSARHPGTNLVIFMNRLGPEGEFEIVGSEDL